MSAWRHVATVVLAAALVAAACSGDEETSSDGAASPDEEALTHAVLDDDTWRVQDAGDPAPGDAAASVERPTLDWYVEYVQTHRSDGRMVRLSGHESDLDDALAELADVGFSFEETTVERHPTAFRTREDEPGSTPAMVLVASEGDTTVMLLSYEVGAEDLTQLAGRIEWMDEMTWDQAVHIDR